MAGAIYEFVHGWTEPVDMQLLRKGVPENLVGKTVSIVATDKNGNTPITGTVSVQDATNGIVRLTPSAGDFDATKSPYRVWWRITNGFLQDAFAPSGEPDIWIIHSLS